VQTVPVQQVLQMVVLPLTVNICVVQAACALVNDSASARASNVLIGFHP
jgi:hypothetical protein